MTKSVFAFVALCFAVGCIADSQIIYGTVRDFTTILPDFGTYSALESGAVMGTLDQDGKMVLKNGAHTSFSSPLWFASWYRSQFGMNIPFSFPFTLTQDTNTGIYTYNNQAYFPIDGVGYGIGFSGHNYYFTTEFENFFVCTGAETFSFETDDDMWVFVDGQLVIDMGGVHATKSSGSFSAASLGLQVGVEHEIKIFSAQRKNEGSVLRIDTNAVLHQFPDYQPLPVPGRDVYICEVLLQNFCPQVDGVECPALPVIQFAENGPEYSFDNFNAISFDSFYAVSGDVEGRIAVRNNLNLVSGQYSVGYELRTGGVSAIDRSLPFSVVVGHDATWTSGAIYPDGTNNPFNGAKENMFVGGTFTGAADLTARRTGGACDSCLDSYFDDAQSFYAAVSDGFAAIAQNVAYTVQYGGMTITCSNPAASAYSLNVDGSVFSAVTYYDLVGCNRHAQIVFNIGGTGLVRFQGNYVPHEEEKVLYNILGSGRTVRIETEVRGSILAPLHTYLQPGMGVVKGRVIVGNIQQAHQINRVNCVNPGPAPQPPSDDHLCPGWETDCFGLNFPLANQIASFRDFNVISFGDFNANTGDVEGRLAVRNNVNLGAGYSIGYELETANNQPDNSLPYSLVAGRNVNWVSGSLHPDGSGLPYPGNREDMFVGGTFNGASDLAGRVHGPCGGAGCLDAYFDNARDCYRGYSNDMASNGDNVDKSFYWSGLFVNCQDANADTYYLSLTPAEMSTFTYTSVSNCNFQANWVINVRGTDNVELTGDSFPAICAGVVYNVIGSGRNVYVHDTSVCGHVLAPDNNLNQVTGVIVGKTVVGNVQMSLQINKHNDCPNPGTVTLPSAVSDPVDGGATAFNLQGNSFGVGDAMYVAGGNQRNVRDAVVYNIVAVDGNTVYTDKPAETNYPAGTYVFVNANGIKGRGPTEGVIPQNSSSNNANAVAVCVALLVALLALAF